MTISGRILKISITSCLWLLLCCSLSHGTETDLACLRSVQHSLIDPHGYLNSSWNFGNKSEGAICTFLGVECWHPDENRVLNLRLSDMGLKGKFPLGLNMCTSITGVDLSSNSLSGSIPDNISHIIGFVTTLDLSSNSFSGEIPVDLANCTYLNTLKLDHNQLSGQIPPQLGFLNRLKTFSVANNLLSGPIPKLNENATVTAADFANNPGLCGAPLPSCPGTSKGPRTGVIAGAAIAGVTVAALGVGIGMLFYYRKVSKTRKKTDDDPDGNKWAKSLKGMKGIKASYHNILILKSREYSLWGIGN
ncbi:hypothetical protein Tsubulata_008737 [Turnera subulata]|uniref:Leucine-rich repeat-containing N-terminal plant-type domain-containing protein n=1 Tax=Turnera subulata TaxID=218843 RepID=A0A9Q0G6R6_9ROSI|nr:hypothetical protein Tsubulata_008737 [Turnera subulata]